MFLKNKNLLNTVVVSISKISNVLLNFLIIRFLTAQLNVENLGIWLTLYSFVAIVQNLDLGISLNLKNELIEKIALKEFKKIPQITLLFLKKTLKFEISLILVFIISWIVNKFFVNHIQNYEILFFVFAGALALLILKLIQSIFSAFSYTGISELFSTLVSLLFYVLILLTYKKYLSLLLLSVLFLVSTIIILVASGIFTNKFFKKNEINFKFFIEEQETISLKNDNLDFFIIQLANLVLFSSDNIIITYLLGASYVPTYTYPYRLFSIINFVFTIVLIPVWPKVGRYFYDKNFNQIVRIEKKLIRVFILLIFFSLLLLFLSDKLYTIWLGENIVVPLILSTLFLIYYVILSWGQLIGTILNSVGRTRIQRNYSVVIVFLNFPLAYLFVKFFNLDLIGVILSNIICLVAGNLVVSHYYYFKFKKELL